MADSIEAILDRLVLYDRYGRRFDEEHYEEVARAAARRARAHDYALPKREVVARESTRPGALDCFRGTRAAPCRFLGMQCTQSTR